MIKVRFAPSPTGYLHIGGVRTALFNFLYAKNQQGEFHLRIEDTDRERSKPEYEEEILRALTWLGLHWDGRVLMRQSERLAVYQEYARQLVQNGLAYESSEDGKTAIKFTMPKKKAVFHDLVHGPVEFDTSLFDDLVILKSDNYPTYHFACVIDDHEMEISHVIRGDDHISNTPRQMMLYEAFGWKPPKFAHLPLIMGGDGTPLSKRHGAVSLTHFKDQGFLPEALLNYLALLGWGIAGNQEFYTLSELVKLFSIKRVNKANARFNMEKLEWLNAQHIKKLSDEDYFDRLAEFYPEESSQMTGDQWRELTLLFKPRIKTLRDLREQAAYCFGAEVIYPDTEKNAVLAGDVRVYLNRWAEEAGQVSFENISETEELTRRVASFYNVEAKMLIHPLRFALTGKTVSPGLFELMKVLGKEKCIARVLNLIK